MKKTLLTIGLILLLTGCTTLTQNSVRSEISSRLSQARDLELTMVQNYNKASYSYYLPPSIGRRESNASSTVLISQNTNILMNLDIVSVLSDKFYAAETTDLLRTYLQKSIPVYAKKGTYRSIDNKEVAYNATVFQVDNLNYLISLQTKYFLFSAIAPFPLAPQLFFDMMVVARTATVDTQEIILLFSNREIINYQKETLDIFSQLAPESGKVIDMISPDAGKEVDDE